MKINGKVVKGNKFAYDGCHKIYILEDENDLKDIYNKGYNDEDVYNIEELENIYNNSCELRFIDNWKLTIQYVKQYEEARFEK